MTLFEYQRRAVALCKDTRAKHLFPGLAAECGEVCGLLQKACYKGLPQLDKDALFEELGDVLWYLTNIAEWAGLSIEDVMRANIEKLEKRHE